MNIENAPTTSCNETNFIHKPGELISDLNTALRLLKEGNKRYVENRTIERYNAEDREIIKDGQFPFAVVVTCSDSRVSPEIYFDQKLGDIFVIRNAGNIADFATLGSVEYAVKHLRVPLVAVVGHSHCGAVSGAFGGGEFSENLQLVIDEIGSAVKCCDNINDAIHANVNGTCMKIRENEVVKETGTTVVGCFYDIASGEIVFD